MRRSHWRVSIFDNEYLNQISIGEGKIELKLIAKYNSVHRINLTYFTKWCEFAHRYIDLWYSNLFFNFYFTLHVQYKRCKLHASEIKDRPLHMRRSMYKSNKDVFIPHTLQYARVRYVATSSE